MRCLTLASDLREKGAEVEFVSRAFVGSSHHLAEAAGFSVHKIPAVSPSDATLTPSDWLQDARETNMVLSNGKRAEWLVVDHYMLDAQWEKEIKPNVKRLMAIDDLADRTHDVDLLLDQNLVDGYLARYQSLVAPECGLLLGPRHALLQPQYSTTRSQTTSHESLTRQGQALIYFGGADSFQLTSMSVDCIHEVYGSSVTMDVILPKQNPQWDKLQRLSKQNSSLRLHDHVTSLASLMSKAEFAIGASGTTSWERLCMGVPALVITLAANQVPIAKALHLHGLVKWIGDVNSESPNELRASLVTCLQDIRSSGIPESWREACMRVVDGRGSQRVVAAMLADASLPLRARLATPDDSDMLLEWANDWVTRKNAFSPLQITIATHQEWFKSKLANFPASQIFVVESLEAVPVGQVRFEREQDEWELHYSLASAFRGRRLGAPLLRSAIDALRQEYGDATVFGRVKCDNNRSCNVFRSLGFFETSIDDNTLKFTLPANKACI